MITLVALALFAQAIPKDFNHQVQVLLDKAYMRPEVEKFCVAHPVDVTVVEIEGIQVTVRCQSWHEWKQQREKA